MKRELDYDWIVENGKYQGFDSYGFYVYQYYGMYITVDSFNKTIVAIEVKND